MLAPQRLQLARAPWGPRRETSIWYFALQDVQVMTAKTILEASGARAAGAARRVDGV
jgi:hypothetical protein